jgi:hypothetical protein
VSSSSILTGAHVVLVPGPPRSSALERASSLSQACISLILARACIILVPSLPPPGSFIVLTVEHVSLYCYRLRRQAAPLPCLHQIQHYRHMAATTPRLVLPRHAVAPSPKACALAPPSSSPARSSRASRASSLRRRPMPFVTPSSATKSLSSSSPSLSSPE